MTTVADINEPKLVTDGGETDIRSAQEVRNSDDAVRHYSADGHLYAYRDGDEHVVVSRGKEPSARWTRRVAAERKRVVPGQQLWTIPGNWRQVASIPRDALDYGIFSVPETSQYVTLSIPTNEYLVDAWYGVKAVGELTVAPVGDLGSRRDVQQIADEYAADGHEKDAEAMQEVASAWGAVEKELEAAVEWVRNEGLKQIRAGDQPLPASSDWTIEFNRDRVYRPGETLARETNIENYEIPLGVILDELRDHAGLPSYYKFEMGVNGSERTMQHDVRALIEAGCSPPQALDYYMAEFEGLSQSAWADERGKAQPSISKNVSEGESHLKA